ncbi:hypothetical protein WBS58_22405 [Bacillus albus]|uniref:hypothetical protein n=1 Tax=Bacillus albus TaxID=2026189 RepID=UPI003014AECE
MEFAKLIKKFESELALSSNHLLNSNERYKSDFIKILKVLFDENVIANHKKMNSYFTRLQLTNKFDKNTYLQSISEIMFLKYVIDKNYTYKLDHTVNQNKNTDIDLLVIDKDFTYNFEIKCPQLSNSISSDKLGIEVLGRFGSKEDFKNEMNIMNNKIFTKITKDDSNTYDGIEYKKIEDNKLKDYLLSAQGKFDDSSDSSINILIVTLESEKFSAYVNYLTNKLNGFFIPEPLNGHIIQPSEFNKVDVVLLSNLVDKHLNIVENTDSWNLYNSINLFYVNHNSKKFTKSNSSNKILEELFNLIPNSTLDFEKWRFDWYKNMENEGVPDLFKFIEPLLLTSYLSASH